MNMIGFTNDKSKKQKKSKSKDYADYTLCFWFVVIVAIVLFGVNVGLDGRNTDLKNKVKMLELQIELTKKD